MSSYFVQNLYGYTPGAPVNGLTTSALSATNLKTAFSFVCPPGGRTLSSVLIRISAATGTPTSGTDGNIVCEIYDSNAAGTEPTGSALGTSLWFTPSPPNAAGDYLTFTGFTGGTSWTAGNVYWIVFSCPNSGVYITHQYASAPTLVDTPYSRRLRFGTYNGAAWTTTNYSPVGCRIGFSEGDYLGLAVSAINQGSPSGTRIYDPQVQGAMATSPANGKMRVIGIVAYVAKSGSADYNVTANIKIGSEAATASGTFPSAMIATTQWHFFYFSSAIEIPASTSFKMYLSAGSGSNTSNYIRINSITFEDSAATRSVLPFNGTMRECTSVNGTWSDVVDNTDELPCMALILDGSQEFGASATGGGLLTHPGMSGGMRG